MNSKEKAIESLKSPDRVGNAGEALSILIGVTGGAASASALATVAGVTTIPVLTSTAAWFGLTVLTATPVGWVVGVGIAGGVAMYGAGKLIRSGGKNDQIRKEILKRIETKLEKRRVDKAYVIDRPPIRDVLKKALDSKLIEQSQAERLALLVAQGKLSEDIAITRLTAILDAGNKR
jgi:hypothetical protein